MKTLPGVGEEVSASVASEMPPLGAEVDAQAEAKPGPEQQRRDRIARLGDIMQSVANPDEKAAVLEVSRKTGADPSHVEENLPFWRNQVAIAQNDPEKFYDQNPEIARAALDQPWLGEIVTKDKPLNTLQRLLAGFRTLVGFTELDELETKMFGAPKTGEDRSLLRAFDPAAAIPGELAGVSPAPQQVPTEKSPLASATGITRLPRLVAAEAKRSFDAIELGALALRYAKQRAAGQDTYDLEKKAIAIRNRSVEQDYDAGPFEQIALDAAQFTGSEAISLGATVAGAVIAGPLGAARARAVAGALSFGTSFAQEFSNLWEFREQKDDQGRPVDDQVAVGSAVLYASLAAAVETGVNLGPWMKLIGPLGKDGIKVEAKAFLRTLARDPAKRAVLARVAQQWAKTAAAEGAEEGVQNVLQDFWGWYARSRSAGIAEGGSFDAQSADPLTSLGEAVDVAGKALVGAAVFGAAPAARHYVTTRREIVRSVAAERQLAAITGAIKESPTAKASPELFTQLVQEETAASGEPVTAAYIDPGAIITLAQESNTDPKDLVREVAGDDGVRRYEEAVATGAKLEVPLQEYVEKWGPSGLAEKLLVDTATRANGVLTPRERVASADSIAAETKRLVDEVGSEQDQPTPSEQLFTGIAQHLAEAGKLPKSKVEPQVKLWRKAVRVEAMKNGLEVDDVAQRLVVKIAAEHQDVVGVKAATRAPEKVRAAEPIAEKSAAKATPEAVPAAVRLSPEDQAKLAKAQEQVKFHEGRLAKYTANPTGGILHDIHYKDQVARAKRELAKVEAEIQGRAQAAVDVGEGMKAIPGGARGPVVAQETQQGAPALVVRGWMETARKGAQRLLSIVLTKDRDLSTFLHETGHAFWELKADLAEENLRPDKAIDPELAKRKLAARADFQAALAWMGVASRQELTDRATEAAKIKADAKAAGRELAADERAKVNELVAPLEKWARGFERYLMEGKAPSLALAGAFRTFKRWLLDVYRQAGALRADLSPEIRGVFDRMLATDEEIAAAARAIGIEGDALEAAKSRAEITALKDVSRSEEQWWKDEIGREREAAAEAYDKLPARRAWRLLRAGETGGDERLAALGTVKLDRSAVIDTVGQEEAEKYFRGVTQKWDRESGEGGIHPDHLASLFQVESGRELLEEMIRLPDRKDWVEARAASMMEAKHPDVLSERARLVALVEKAIHEEPSVVDELHRSWSEDRKAAGAKGGPPIEAIRAAAKIIIGRQLVQQVQPRKYFNNERSAYRKRAEVLAKGNKDAAAVLSQQRLLNFYLYREATQAKERIEKVQELASKLESEKGQERLGQASPAYRDMSLRILQAAGLRESVPAEAQNAGMLDLVQGFQEQDIEPDFDLLGIETLLRSPKAFGDLSLAQLENVQNALLQIRRAARNRLTVIVNNRRIALDTVVADIGNEASRLPKLPAPAEVKTQRTFKQGALWSTGQGILAAITDPLTTYLDDDYLGSTARAAIRDRYYQARSVEHELLKEAAMKVQQAFDEMPREMQRRQYDLVDRSMLPRLEGQRRDGAVDRSWMYSILANLGNASNMQRSLEGRGWTLDQVREFFRVNKLTADEARFIQALWDLNDKHLWPKLVEVHERVNGTKPQKIEAAPLTLDLADGEQVTLRGGYWPAMYDPVESKLGLKQDEASTTSELNYETFRASIIKGFTRGRVDRVTDVIRFDDFGLYPSHVLKVIRYIAYEEMVRDTNRIFSAIKNTVEDRLGSAAFDQLDRWLHVVASGSPDSIAAAERGFVRGAGFVVSRVVLTAMMLNLKNAMADIATPLITAFGPRSSRVRADYLLGALLEGTAGLAAPSAIGRGWFAMRKEALENSSELRVRGDEATRRMRQQAERFGAGGKRWHPFGLNVEPGRLLEWIQHNAFVFQHVAEVWGTTISFEAARRQALDRGASPEDANRFGNDVLQKVFPSALPAEKSHVIRSKGFVGSLLIMQGFFNRAGNRIRQTAHPAMVEFGNAEGWWEKAKTAPEMAEAGAMVLGILGVVGVLGSLLEGRGPEQGEDTPEWLKRKMISTPLSVVPLFSELAPTAEYLVAQDEAKGRIKFQASERSAPLVSSALRLLNNLGALADEEKDDAKRAWAAYEVLAFALGLPVSQVKRTVPYLADVAAGDKPLEVTPLIYGDRDRAAENPTTFLEDEIQNW